MTRNRAIDRFCARQRHLRMLEETADSYVVAGTVDETPPVESVRRDDAAQIRAAVNELSQDQRRPIELAFFDGLTHFEIAAALAEPLGTIKARIRRGMMRLREELEDRAGSPTDNGDMPAL